MTTRKELEALLARVQKTTSLALALNYASTYSGYCLTNADTESAKYTNRMPAKEMKMFLEGMLLGQKWAYEYKPLTGKKVQLEQF